MPFQSYLPIADLMLELRTNDISLFRLFRDEYYCMQNLQKPTASIDIRLNKAIYYFKVPLIGETFSMFNSWIKNRKNLNYIIRAFISFYALQNNIIFLHGSASVYRGLAYVYIGKSGSGKTTIIRTMDRDAILGDDVVVIKKEKKDFYVYTSPFDNEDFPNLNRQKVKLGKIFLLKQAKITCFNNLSYQQQLYGLVENSIFINDFISIMKLLVKRKFLKQLSDRYLSIQEKKYFEMLFLLIEQNLISELAFTKKIDFLKKII